MRAGSEQFLVKDYAFYDSMITPVLGSTTITVYEVLRRFVWRTSESGALKARQAWARGRLTAVVCQKKVAAMAGVGLRTVGIILSKLRAIGWIRGEYGGDEGEVLAYELGVYRPELGGECYYADGWLQGLWTVMTREAHHKGLKMASELDSEKRKEIAYMHVRCAVNAQGVRSGNAGGAQPQRRGCAGIAYRIDNENREQNREREVSGRFAADTPFSLLTGEEPDSPFKKTNSKDEEDIGTSNGKNPFLHPSFDVNFDKMAASNSEVSHGDAEESHGGSEKSDDERRQAVATALAAGKQKADQQRQANEAKRRVKAQRTAQVKQKQAKEQKAANLKGRSYPRDVVEAAKKAWKTYADLIEKVDPEFVVPRWTANGNVKARGQMCQLIEMYGGPATEQALQYLIGNWEVIGARYFKNSPGGIPNLGRLVVLHEQIYREAVLWARHREVLQEWNDWYKGREYTAPRPPADLRARYDSAREALQSLGLGA